MDLSKTPSVIDQLFDAIDRREIEAARYRLSTAIDRAKRAGQATGVASSRTPPKTEVPH